MAKVLMSIYQHLPLSLATLIFPTKFWHQTKYISFKLEPQNLLPSLLIFWSYQQKTIYAMQWDLKEPTVIDIC